MDYRLDALLDDELNDAERDAFMVEMEADPVRRAEIERALLVRNTLRTLPAHACPSHVKTNVLAVAQRRRSDRPGIARNTRMIRPVALSLAAAIVLLIVLSPLRLSPPEPTDAEVQRALEDVQWAFAVVADVGRVTGEAVRDQVIPQATEPARKAVRRIIPDENEQIQ